MSVAHCLGALREADPLRFGMVMAAPADARAGLAPLYALNLELARAPLQSAEPMLAEMRLQWWADRLAAMAQGAAPPAHEVLTPLWDAWGARAGDLGALVEARRRDCAREPFNNEAQVIDYVDETSGSLMAAATGFLGAGGAAMAVVADQARAAGLAAWLRALPQLRALGLGLAAPDAALAGLAVQAQAALDRASAARRAVPRRAAPALYGGAGLRGFLSGVAQGAAPQDVPAPAPFAVRAGLARLALTGRWWA